MVPCPTCGASGEQQCVRGRKSNGGMGVNGAIWKQQIPFPEGHDSRRSANKPKINFAEEIAKFEAVNPPTFTNDDLMALADEIGQKVARGELPPKDENGFYIL